MLGSRQALAAVGAGVAALALGACGSSQTKTSGASAATIQRAASVSGTAKGFKVAETLSSTVPQVGQMTLKATGGVNSGKSRNGQLNMTVKIPELAGVAGGRGAALSNMATTLMLDSGNVYVKVPGALSSYIGPKIGAKPWVKFNLSALGKAGGIPGLSSLFSGSGSSADPSQYLQQLSGNADSVQKLGTDTVDGVKATHYHAVVDLAKLANDKRLSPATKKALNRLDTVLRKQEHETTVPEDVWVDNANLVRRIKISQTIKTQSGSVPENFQIDFLSYGPQPAPKVPAPSQVFDLGPLMTKALHKHAAAGLL